MHCDEACLRPSQIVQKTLLKEDPRIQTLKTRGSSLSRMVVLEAWSESSSMVYVMFKNKLVDQV